MKVIELFCGGFGWSAGFLDQGWRSIGFDLEHHPWHGSVPYNASLVLQDVLTLDGAQFKDADVIVASPPCTEFSYRAMPFKRCKSLGPPHLGIKLFWSCFRIQHEASQAAGSYIPMVVENVKGAQPWIGRAKAHYGSFYLWGDVASVGGRIVVGGNGFGETLRVGSRSIKIPDQDWSRFAKTGEVSPHWNMQAIDAVTKNTGGSWFGQRDGKALERNDPRDMRKAEDGTCKQGGNNHPGKSGDGLKGLTRRMNPSENSRSSARKAASAAIARIPYPLSAYVAARFTSAMSTPEACGKVGI